MAGNSRKHWVEFVAGGKERERENSAEARRESDGNSATGLGSGRLAMEGKEFGRLRGGIWWGFGLNRQWRLISE